MSFSLRGSLPLLALSLTSCLSMAPHHQGASVGATENDAVPARRWANNRCAAGALSEVLNSMGDPVSEVQLNESLAKGRSGGVVTVDLLLAARARGFDAQLIKGDLNLVRGELEQGHPLILMLRVMDAPGSTDDLFHYVVLTGFDPQRELVRMHYGDGQRRWVDLRPLQKSWAAAGNATFLISSRKSQIAGEDDLRRAVVLEDAGKLEDAVSLYRFFLRSHPESALAWTNLANAHAAMGEDRLAEAEYRNALIVEPDRFDALNNLAWMLLGQGRLAEAEELARRAAAQDVGDRQLAVDTLNRILERKAAPVFQVPSTRDSPAPMRITPKSGAARSARPYWTAYAALTAATIFDMEATFYRLNHCRECREGNPILRPFVEDGRAATYLFSGIVNGVIMVMVRRMYEGGSPLWRLVPGTFAVVHAIAGARNLYLGADEGT